jgi:hypothetical protein
LTRLPIQYAAWSPAKAPAAADTSTSVRSGVPAEMAVAARAMTTDSLGIGGKNPSIVANRNITR